MDVAILLAACTATAFLVYAFTSTRSQDAYESAHKFVAPQRNVCLWLGDFTDDQRKSIISSSLLTADHRVVTRQQLREIAELVNARPDFSYPVAEFIARVMSVIKRTEGASLRISHVVLDKSLLAEDASFIQITSGKTIEQVLRSYFSLEGFWNKGRMRVI